MLLTKPKIIFLSIILLALLTACQPNQDIAKGGRLYDKWWVEAGSEAPAESQPLWAQQATNERTGADTWRCKECHGWDYLGAGGAYGSGSHYTGFVGVWSAREKSASELMAILSGQPNPDHDFSSLLSASELKLLVKFLREGMMDMRPYISADKVVNGDPEHGQRLYRNGCVACHGEQGNEMNSGDADDEVVILGKLAHDNPWEVFHKAAFGQPGKENMTAGVQLNWSAQDIADVLAFLQTLPVK